MTLKSLMIVAAQAALATARAAEETALRGLVEAENSLPDWYVTAPNDPSASTCEIGGSNYTADAIVSALTLLGYVDVFAHPDIPNTAVLKSATQPSGFSIRTNTWDDGSQTWITNSPYTAEWSALS